MLTKRMMLGAGALALTLTLAACSEDGAGGATGVSDAPTAGPVNPAAPLAIVTPPTPDRVVAGGGTGGGGVPSGTATTIATTYYDGHQVVLSEVTTSSGAKLSRVTLDGDILMDVHGALDDLTMGSEVTASFYAGGELIMQDQLLSGVLPTATIRRPSDGPQAAQALPCLDELAAFGAASVALSFTLYVARYAPTARNLALAGAAAWAVWHTGLSLYECLHERW